MSVVSFFYPVSIFLWYFLNGINPTEGSSAICEYITCSSDEYQYEYCELNEDVTVVNASVTTINSRAKCINTQDYRSDDYEGIGFYGYDGNIFWVDKGCSGKFAICYMDGASFDCKYRTCSSEEYKLQKCVVDGDVKIVNISVDDTKSRTICVNAQDYTSDHNEDIGFYGYNENIFWVDKGCSAEFKICYTVNSSSDSPTSTSPVAETSSFTYSSSMISSPPTTFSEMLTTENDIDPISTSATETTRETATPTTEFYGTHSQAQKQHQQDSSDTTIVIIVVAVVAGVLVLGIIGIVLCRIRYKRNGTRRTDSESAFDHKTEKIPHTVNDSKERNYKTPPAKTANDVSADTQGQLNLYEPLSNGKSVLRNETNENQELKANKRPIPAKRRVAKENAKAALVAKRNKDVVKSSNNNPVSMNNTEVRDEQREQSDDYLEPVSNRSSLEESDNYIDLQPETSTAFQKVNTLNETDEENHVYDYIDPMNVPDISS